MFYAVSSSTSGTTFTIPFSGLSLDCVPSLLQISARLAFCFCDFVKSSL